MNELFGISIEVYFFLILIIIPTSLFWYWLLKKFIKEEKKRIIATWITTFAMAPVIYDGLFILLVTLWFYTPNKNFDKLEWETNTDNRFQMADDIIERKMLIDKDTSQIKLLLGEHGRGWTGNKPMTWTYDMGFGKGIFVFHHLEVRFENNKVISVEHIVIQD